MKLSFVTGAVRGRGALSTVAEGLERLSRYPACFRPEDKATISVADLPMPSGRRIQSPTLLFTPASGGDLTFAAVLAPASHCRATDIASGKRTKYEMRLLHEAIVDNDGRATLRDGAILRAIEVIPDRIQNPSELDWQILATFIAARGAENWCYRDILDGLEPELRKQVPDLACHRRIDLTRVPELDARLLKRDVWEIRAQDPTLNVSKEKLAQTLAVFGIRERKIRRQASRGKATKSPRSGL